MQSSGYQIGDMKRFAFPLSALLLVLASACNKQEKGNARWVDPLIGTQATHFISEWRSEGCTYPGAVAPHGMVQVTPETSAPGDYLKGYYYEQDTIRRFSMVEHYSGWPDGSRGGGVFMPFSLPEEVVPSFANAASAFSHAHETARAGYYQVLLSDSRINCEFASLPKSGIGQLQFEKEGPKGLLLSSNREVSQVSPEVLQVVVRAGSGYIGQKESNVYVHWVFDQPIQLEKGRRHQVVKFPEVEGKGKVSMKYGASYTSMENARLNLETEIPTWSFTAVKQQAKEKWDQNLDRVDIPKGKTEDKKMFYTALYHLSLLPMNATDVNGQYPGHEANEPLEEGESHYIYYTPWDAFRSKHPLVNLLYPDKSRDFMRSLVRIYKDAGRLPEPRVMTGVHLSGLVADALAKGITDFEVETAYEGLADMILHPPYFRPQMALYDSLGHVPYPQRYATTATLEFAFNDWALAQVARYLGKTAVAEKLEKRSLNYRNHFNPANRFMETKNEDGTWAEASIYAEANAWNMSWFVPHDPQGLINLMGGDEAFSDHLNRNFQEGHFVLDNECPLNFPFLFSYAHKPWKSMEWAHKTRQYYFNERPGGIPGNDDWGSLSSWLAFAQLGFFPATPGVDELVITGPVFEEVILKIPGRQETVIEAKQASNQNMYVQACTVDGEPYDRAFISQKDLLNGRRITFQMGSKPNENWGLNGREAYSLTQDVPLFVVSGLQSTKREVDSHEPFMLSLALHNEGTNGSFPLVVRQNDEPIDTTFVLLAEGESRRVEIPLKLYQGGAHSLSVGEESVAVKVNPVALSPQQSFAFGAPQLSPFVRWQDSLHYQFTVQNISGQELSYAPPLLLDQAVLSTLESILLKPGEEKIIKGSLPPVPSLGFHELGIASGPGTRFKVYKKASETLALHYTFEEGPENILDHSGFGNHGRVVGQVQFVKGLIGKGIQTEGGYVQVPESPSLFMEEEELTMLCSYQPADEDGKASLITKGGHNMMKLNGKWQLQLAIGGWGVGQCTFNAPYDESTGQPAWLGKWSHFAGTRSDDVLRVFFNGELKSQLKVKGEIGHTDWAWRIGSNAEIPLGRTPDGVIDEVMIFAKALTEEEVREIYDQYPLP
jgi:predicted alpha-1,2-mannosidase